MKHFSQYLVLPIILSSFAFSGCSVISAIIGTTNKTQQGTADNTQQGTANNTQPGKANNTQPGKAPKTQKVTKPSTLEEDWKALEKAVNANLISNFTALHIRDYRNKIRLEGGMPSWSIQRDIESWMDPGYFTDQALKKGVLTEKEATAIRNKREGDLKSCRNGDCDCNQSYCKFKKGLPLLPTTTQEDIDNYIAEQNARIAAENARIAAENENARIAAENEKARIAAENAPFGIPDIPSGCVQFHEKAFESYALAQWDDNNDGCISPEESKNATQIPQFTFAGNEEITTLDDLNQFPTLQSIGEGAFAGASKLDNVRLKYVTQIGKDAFKDCNNLVELHIPQAKSIGEYAFSGTDIKYGPKRSDTIELNNIKQVKEGAFSFIGNQQNNVHVKFKIKSQAHFGNTFGQIIFAKNSNISDIYISIRSAYQHELVSIAAGMFANCPALSNVIVDVHDSNDFVIGESAFQICPSLSRVEISGNSGLYIGKNAFTNAPKLSKFECSSYDSDAFGNNPNITSIFGEPKTGSPNVLHPENILLTLPDSFSSQVEGNYFDNKEWKTVRLRDQKQFSKEKYVISAE